MILLDLPAVIEREGFSGLVRANIRDSERYVGMYWSVRCAAIFSVQTIRNDHPELNHVNWGNLNHDYKLELAENTFAIALQEHAALEIVRQCPDFRPCLIIVQVKRTQMSCYRRRQR